MRLHGLPEVLVDTVMANGIGGISNSFLSHPISYDMSTGFLTLLKFVRESLSYSASASSQMDEVLRS